MQAWRPLTLASPWFPILDAMSRLAVRSEYLVPYQLVDEPKSFGRIKGVAAAIATDRLQEMQENVGVNTDGFGQRGTMDEDYLLCEHIKYRLAHAAETLPDVIRAAADSDELLTGDPVLRDAYLRLDDELRHVDLSPRYALGSVGDWPAPLQTYLLAAAVAAQAFMERLVTDAYDAAAVAGPRPFPILHSD